MISRVILVVFILICLFQVEIVGEKVERYTVKAINYQNKHVDNKNKLVNTYYKYLFLSSPKSDYCKIPLEKRLLHLEQSFFHVAINWCLANYFTEDIEDKVKCQDIQVSDSKKVQEKCLVSSRFLWMKQQGYLEAAERAKCIEKGFISYDLCQTESSTNCLDDVNWRMNTEANEDVEIVLSSGFNEDRFNFQSFINELRDDLGQLGVEEEPSQSNKKQGATHSSYTWNQKGHLRRNGEEMKLYDASKRLESNETTRKDYKIQSILEDIQLVATVLKYIYHTRLELIQPAVPLEMLSPNPIVRTYGKVTYTDFSKYIATPITPYCQNTKNPSIRTEHTLRKYIYYLYTNCIGKFYEREGIKLLKSQSKSPTFAPTALPPTEEDIYEIKDIEINVNEDDDLLSHKPKVLPFDDIYLLNGLQLQLHCIKDTMNYIQHSKHVEEIEMKLNTPPSSSSLASSPAASSYFASENVGEKEKYRYLLFAERIRCISSGNVVF
jgi:hypothetical protein